MSNQYKVIDEKIWDRATLCMVFRNSVEPAFCVTFEADVTGFKHMVKEQGLSFTLAMVYAVCKCANKIEAFRYRFVDGQKEYFTGPLGNDVFQCSPMPWVTYTHISHTNSGKAHHSFVDGIHIGQFVDELQCYLNECTN